MKKDYKVKVAKKKRTTENRNLIQDLHIERARKQKCESQMNKLNREIQEEKLKIKRLEMEEEANDLNDKRGGSAGNENSFFNNRPKSVGIVNQAGLPPRKSRKSIFLTLRSLVWQALQGHLVY